MATRPVAAIEHYYPNCVMKLLFTNYHKKIVLQVVHCAAPFLCKAKAKCDREAREAGKAELRRGGNGLPGPQGRDLGVPLGPRGRPLAGSAEGDQGADNIDQVGYVYGLYDVVVGAKFLCALHIRGEETGAQDNDAVRAKVRRMLEPLEDLAAIHPGHFPVEEQQQRHLVVLRLSAVAALENGDGLFAVRGINNADVRCYLSKRVLEQEGRIRVVFGNEYVTGRRHLTGGDYRAETN